MHCVRVRGGGQHIRTRTLVSARRCLSAVEDAISPDPANAVALATVMTQMAESDTRLAALLDSLDDRRSPFDPNRALRCGRGGLTTTER